MVRFSVPEMLRKRWLRGCRRACGALSRALGAGCLCYLLQTWVAAAGSWSLGYRWPLVRDIHQTSVLSPVVVEEDRTRKP
jgi:hypothetical protein